MPERRLPDDFRAGSWRRVGTSSPIVAPIEASNEQIANLLAEPIPPQFVAEPQPEPMPYQWDAEWVSKGDLYIKVFKLCSYSRSSYVS